VLKAATRRFSFKKSFSPKSGEGKRGYLRGYLYYRRGRGVIPILALPAPFWHSECPTRPILFLVP